MTEPGYQPHYRLIEQALRERIAALSPGDRLPSEAELCAQFGVSRMTARNAMERLAHDGLIRREPGRGSFVAPRPVHRRANRLMTFTREMQRSGRRPTSRLLSRALRPSTADEAATLALAPASPVVEVRRLRLADDEPIAVESALLVAATAEHVLRADLVRGSLHETLTRAGFVLHHGSGTISAAAATGEDAALLSIRAGDPLLVERRVILDAHGRPVEATESRYAADRYGLEVQFDVEVPDLAAEAPPGRAVTGGARPDRVRTEPAPA
jgi:GntR family transcriptional regulator